VVGGVNPAEIMAEVAETLGGLPGIRAAHGHPVGKLGGFPAVVVGYGRVEYGVLSDDGHRITLPVWIVVGGNIERETAAKLGRYAGDTGSSSVLRALNDKDDWTTCDQVTLVDADTDVITIGDSDYLTVVLSIDVAATS
jgi:hypothetical protein